MGCRKEKGLYPEESVYLSGLHDTGATGGGKREEIKEFMTGLGTNGAKGTFKEQ